MPPQQTNVTFLTRRAAARPRLTNALVPDTAGAALAEVRTAASIAVLRDAFSEKQAAGPPAASSVLRLLQAYWHAFQERRRRARLLLSVHHLSERELIDIGVTQSDVDCIIASQAIERLRDSMTCQWLSRGVM